MTGPVAPAALPPPGLPGLDPAWSRLVTADDADGVARTWHVLDNGAEATVGTMLCVHGNPTWAYLWRRFIAQAPPGWRVVAVDQLGMGFSERPAEPRTLARRIDDLDTVLGALGVTGAVVPVGHDWGGPVSLGWAVAHPDRLLGVVLGNTAVHQPAGSAAPTLIRLARLPLLRGVVCTGTPTFVRATSALSRPALPRPVRDALAAPYDSPARRRAVGDFVADIPLEPGHVSAPALDGVTAGLERLAGVPLLLLWGPRDPVFSERYFRDLLSRLPHADVHRYPRASHLVTEDAPETAEHAWRWVDALSRGTAGPPDAPPGSHRPLWTELVKRAGDSAPAVVEMTADGHRAVPFELLERRVRELAAGLAAVGVRAGDRVALLVPPGADLVATAYACWRVGAVVVVADAGLGPGGLVRALRGAAPDHVVGIPRGLALARVLAVPGRRVVAGPVGRAGARLVGATDRLAELARLGRDREPPPAPAADAECAVLFTSGATGPAKGVVYRHRQLAAQLAALRATFGLGADDNVVAAFPPFVLYGPALGVTSAVPAAAAPGTLTAAALADAVAAARATVVFASPAVLRSLVSTADALTPAQRSALGGVRLLISAGAPVPVALLHALRAVLPAAEAHTPYGMTEALPVTDITLAGIDAAGPGNGVCVGPPVPGVEVRISPLSGDGAPTTGAGVTGEIRVRAAHVKDRYDLLWATGRDAASAAGWHATGDVGHLDEQGRLWVEGRLGHVVHTARGPVTPVGVEQRVQDVDGVRAAAAVGVGPRGAQQVVVVVTGPGQGVRAAPRLAAEPLATAVRAAAGTEIAAVLVTDALPVDVRHAAKVDRARVARWAERVLAGGRTGRRP